MTIFSNFIGPAYGKADNNTTEEFSLPFFTKKIIIMNWDQYYGKTEYKVYWKNPHKRISISSGNVYIRNCLFNDCNSVENGGAINLEEQKGNKKVLVESTLFYSCSSTNSGGAIYCSESLDFILSRVCGISCSSISSDNQFCFIRVTNSHDSRNEVYSTTVCKSELKNDQCSCVMYIFLGTIKTKENNHTFNSCNVDSFVITATVDSQKSWMSLSNFVNNTEEGWVSVRLEYIPEATQCNIIENRQLVDRYGIFHVRSSKAIVTDSCILKNSGIRIIDGFADSGAILQNCCIDFDNGKVGGLSKIESTASTSFLNAFSLIKEADCEAIVGYQKTKKVSRRIFINRIFLTLYFVISL